MDIAHSSSFLKKLSLIRLCLLFFGVHLFFHISSSLAPGFSHRDSPDSPLHPAASIKLVPSRAEVRSKGTVYVVRIFLGSQLKEMYAAISTGSNLNWVLCEPCPECYTHEQSMFNASLSDTYEKIDCHDDHCSLLQKKNCDNHDKCEYTFTYNDASHVIGILSKDELRFKTLRGRVDLNHFLFGCTQKTNGSFSKHSLGIIGLGRAPLSLVSQLGYEIFSYCLPSWDKTPGWLNFGPIHAEPGPGTATTNLIDVHSSFYKVNLMSITVEGADQPVVIMPPQGRKFVIDTGTSLTYINDGSMNQLSEAVTNSTPYPVVENRPPEYDLCFDVSKEPKNPRLPWINFYFAVSAVVRLSPPNIFLRIGSTMMCLSIMSNVRIGGELNILGSEVQMGHVFIYDLKNNKVSFGEWGKC